MTVCVSCGRSTAGPAIRCSICQKTVTSSWRNLYGYAPTQDPDQILRWADQGFRLGIVLNEVPLDGPSHSAHLHDYGDRLVTVCKTTGRTLVLPYSGEDEWHAALELSARTAQAWGCSLMVLAS